jgi:hypothetical protein
MLGGYFIINPPKTIQDIILESSNNKIWVKPLNKAAKPTEEEKKKES